MNDDDLTTLCAAKESLQRGRASFETLIAALKDKRTAPEHPRHDEIGLIMAEASLTAALQRVDAALALLVEMTERGQP